ncbi:UNVERIFIED_CONTAM: hypothetical protein HDU68_005466, partial [Siphonaria sp. JEL0065]
NLMHRHHCERLKWGKHWDWTCLTSPEDVHELPAQPAGKAHHIDEHVKPVHASSPVPPPFTPASTSPFAGAGYPSAPPTPM